MIGRGAAGPGVAWRGEASHGSAWQSKGSETRLRAGLPDVAVRY